MTKKYHLRDLIYFWEIAARKDRIAAEAAKEEARIAAEARDSERRIAEAIQKDLERKQKDLEQRNKEMKALEAKFGKLREEKERNEAEVKA